MGWAGGEPFVVALLATPALLELPISAPQRQRLLTADVHFLKELGAAEVSVKGLFQLKVVCRGLALRNCRLRVVSGN